MKMERNLSFIGYIPIYSYVCMREWSVEEEAKHKKKSLNNLIPIPNLFSSKKFETQWFMTTKISTANFPN